ncbi:lipopolysaccharide biosynthesis protein [Paraburkholderia solisilvae]|uniref:Teichuronic acid biosynthesis protein TuaB n=1 Tax=Paraburkholderia solisilvae TaxID=624376 RepID=A0A6J5DI09_9BURK|nr:lipopolysaccharide biosynthesis protein [Paraburkholderia solisilvae]CAB3753859.1 Teichuronic acid biosynthesis protein TuaB [Paraburkholderia solisilvae]
MSTPQPSVGRNARWLATAQIARSVIQLIGLAILSRLLSPADFGVMALATIVTNFAGLLRDMGTGPALIRSRDMSPTLVNSVFWVNIGAGTAIALAIVAFSVPLARLFNSGSLSHVLCWLALTFPIMSFGAAHQALLERASQFRTVARSDVLSYTSGMVAAIVSAYFGLGLTSLVVQALVQSSMSSLQMYLASPWRPTLRWDLKEVREIFGFSSNLTLSNFVIYLNRNTDSMIVGKVLGAVALGPYSLAFKIMLYPLQSVAYVAAKALYPVLSANQTDPDKQRASYLQSVSFVALITAPLMGGLVALREPFIAVALGAKWASVAPLLVWLAPVGFVQSVLSTAPAVFMVKGRTDWLLMLNFCVAMLHIACWLIGAHFGGLQGIAAGYLVASLASTPIHLGVTARLLDMPFSALFRALRWQVVLGVGVCLFATVASRAIGPLDWPALARLIVAGLVGVAYGLWHISRFNPDQMLVLRRVLRFA